MIRPAHLAFVFIVALLASGAPAALAQEGKTAPAGVGLKAYVDPETGELTTPPPSNEIRLPAQSAMAQSGRGLVERPAPIGGFMVDLEGRFQAPLVAVPRADGSVAVTHDTTPENESGGAR